MKAYSVICVFFALSWVLLAQETANPPLPEGPLLANPDSAHWIVTTTPSGTPTAGATSSGVTTTVDTTKTADIYHILISDAKGQSSRWCEGKIQFVQLPGWGAPVLIDQDNPHGAARYITIGKSLFPELNWVSPSTYTGVKTDNGRKCLVFTNRDTSTATIDLETRFPVSYVKPGETSLYQILPPPAGKQALPPDLQKIYDQFMKRQKDLQYKAPQA